MTKRLLLLLGFAVLAVVFNHATVYGFSALFERSDPEFVRLGAQAYVPDYNERGSLTYYALLFIKQLIAFGVPVFLFVSGYFVAFAAGRKEPKLKWDVVKTRILALVIPYTLWTIIIFVMQAVVYRRTLFFQGGEFVGYLPGIWAYVQALIFGEVTTAYYYVPLLVQYYLLSPFLVPLAKNRWKELLIIASIIQLFVDGLRYFQYLDLPLPGLEVMLQMTPLWFFPRRIFWFTLGIVFGFHFQDFKPYLVKLKTVFPIAAVIFLGFSIFEFDAIVTASGEGWIGSFPTFSNIFYSLCVIFGFLLHEKLKLPYEAQLSDLGTKSFGVYLLNDQALELTGRILFSSAHFILSYQILYLPIMVIAGLGIPLLLMYIVNKSPARPYYKYIFG